MTKTKNIYFDNSASTNIDEDTLELMVKLSRDIYANPSSIHRLGQRANAILEESREKAAHILGCKKSEIIFTATASEANNMVLSYKHNKIAISPLEHSTIDIYSKRNNVIYIPINNGDIELDYIVREQPDLVAIAAVNNETGLIQPINRVREHFKGLIHSDCVQAVHIVRDIASNVDSLTLSAHKFHGPKGCGILMAKSRALLKKFVYGSNRERNKRAGTENIPAIAATVYALEKAVNYNYSYVEEIRDYFESELLKRVCARVNSKDNRAPHISSISFKSIRSDLLLFNLDLANIFASAGSACNSGSLDPSHILKNIGLSEEEVLSTIRFSFSKNNSKEEVDIAINEIVRIVSRMKGIS